MAENKKSEPEIHRSGEVIYETYCFACHNYGAAGAPKLSQIQDWSDRLSQNKATLVHNLETGLGAMPRRGSCFDCTDQELVAVVDYIRAQLVSTSDRPLHK